MRLTFLEACAVASAPSCLPGPPLVTHDEDVLVGQDVRTLAGRICDERDLRSRDGGRGLEDLLHVHHGGYFVTTAPLHRLYFGMDDCKLEKGQKC